MTDIEALIARLLTWEDPANKGYPCFPRNPDGEEAAEVIRALSGAVEAERERCRKLLKDRAAHLRTPQGRLDAQWHESDATMVANELDRQAAAIWSSVEEGGK